MNDKLKIAVANFPPLVIADDNKFEGFEIELWEKIAQKLNIDYEYIEYSFVDVLSKLKNKEVDLAIAGITINEEREEYLDFSYRTFDSGLNILTNIKKGTNIFTMLKYVLNMGVAKILLLLVSFIFISANILWFIERGSKYINANYSVGIMDAVWWGVITVSTVGYGDVVPLSFAGRIVGIFVVMIGLAIFGLYIAKVSSSMAIQEIKSDIQNQNDLRSKIVATVQGTTSVSFLQNIGAKVVEVKNIEEAYKKLDKFTIDAVVFDSPALLHYQNSQEKNKFVIAGELMKPQIYGIAFKEGSSLREGVNRALLTIRESGEYNKLYKKWFGDN